MLSVHSPIISHDTGVVYLSNHVLNLPNTFELITVICRVLDERKEWGINIKEDNFGVSEFLVKTTND